jgi:secreted PhoX family phosphatase
MNAAANQRVRVVAVKSGRFYGQAMVKGDIYTIAGTGGDGGFSGDGGPATSAQLRDPAGVTIDQAGNVVLADLNNDRVRVIAESTGTFYSQAMTAGDIYTIAGTGHSRESGDGGPAVKAQLSQPDGLGFDGAGDLFVADLDFGRIREISG